MKLVVNEITEEIGKKLVELGYTDTSNAVKNHKCYYKNYDIKGRFALIINPYGEPYNTVAISYYDNDFGDNDNDDEYYYYKKDGSKAKMSDEDVKEIKRETLEAKKDK